MTEDEQKEYTRRTRLSIVGALLAGCGVVVVGMPVVVGDGVLTLTQAATGLALVAVGGILMDPTTFRPLVEQIIAKLRQP